MFVFKGDGLDFTEKKPSQEEHGNLRDITLCKDEVNYYPFMIPFYFFQVAAGVTFHAGDGQEVFDVPKIDWHWFFHRKQITAIVKSKHCFRSFCS